MKGNESRKEGREGGGGGGGGGRESAKIPHVTEWVRQGSRSVPIRTWRHFLDLSTSKKGEKKRARITERGENERERKQQPPKNGPFLPYAASSLSIMTGIVRLLLAYFFGFSMGNLRPRASLDL